MNAFELREPDWNAIEPARLTAEPKLQGHVLVLPTQFGEVSVTISQFGLRLNAGTTHDETFKILTTTPSNLPLLLKKLDQGFAATAGEYRLEFYSDPFYFKLYKNDKLVQQSATDGHFVRQHRLPPLAKTDNGWILSLELNYDEAVYGLGEKWGKLDKRGQLIRSYNHDALGVNAEKSYKNTPYAWSPEGWNLFVHTPAPVTHGVGYALWSQRAYVCLVEDDALDVFLYHEQTPAQSINRYCELTGFAPVPPQWSFGVILSKAYYKDADELLSVAREVRAKNMPCDVITLDGRAWQDTDTRFAFEWDPTRYADPKPVLDELKAMDFKICVWEYPMISVNNPLFAKAAENGWLIKDKRTGKAYQYEWDLSPFGEVLTPLPESGILDFTHPDAYEYWLESHKPLFELGVDMIKADFGEQLEDENMVSHSGDSGIRLHNVYSMLYNRCVYEAAEKYCKTGPFLFSRSAWTGSQRFPAQWGGDPQADWQGLAASIRGSLAWGMSGGPFFATDIGGFYKDTRDAELYVRWAQASIFSAHMRLHGIGPREPWSYTEQASDAVFAALKLRYQLIPYLQECAEQAQQTGLPIQRAMALAFPDDVLTHSFDQQFMCGEKLLVVPCVVPNGKVKFYLPQGEWVRFPDAQTYQGGKYYEETLELTQMAVFVRKGDTLMLGPDVQHTEQDMSQLTAWPK
ncbi:glycoside hydrolase family 31 protein [Pseudoalteromonas sp. CST5]|uniref:glycoside hydrolase family 31 protein n=1 Tax=unclassified Pseudoalteromonas TaxID=194690 RepID=UPI002359B804|nr:MULTISPECIES: TIM-barrel domain-containing protein [unclassified Pseudoalteromonas]MDC9514208.1 glycoside hydrolase family 31 protein [Pseudoalteromonas sp. CST1]MDC9538692.1 glycoside hydrolase family 31 protein [Pseudoalteromonas sp. CST3]MDC9542907.1 glycoside hydrolase family 31 protein [Pseudoalteromonas sp. CST2]MDC9545604.1 glycoside hydrolase family 31 protein [Pseudoalteromonas sp. CST4]MDC9550441.1 glycoside hydrolase family 31 protein [Pseudoalteromonas sp. CST5]